MLPVILVAVGAYLIGDSVLGDKKYAKGGQLDAKSAKKRLEQLRKELRSGKISYGELAELESLKEYIDKGDVELLEAAGVPEYENEDEDDDDKMDKGGEVDKELIDSSAKSIYDKKGMMSLRNTFLQVAKADEDAGDKETAEYRRKVVAEYQSKQPKFMAKGGKIKDFIEWDKIIGKKVNGWEAQDNNGISILWENDKSKYTIYATPRWENDKKLPIQITSENGDIDIAMFSKNVDASYELNEYLKEVKKIIKIIGNKKYLDVSDFKNDFSKVIDNSNFAKGGEVDDKISKVVKAIRKTRIDPDDVSPNFVNKIANEIGVSLSSKEVVYISDNYDVL
jgi:hypothetical protein